MPWQANVLVVANLTGSSPELVAALRERADRGPTSFTLVLPAADGSQIAAERAAEQLEQALAAVRDAGLEVEGTVGVADPVAAVQEIFDPRRFDEIIVSTLPAGASRWLQIDLPHRIERLTGAPVSHVVASPPAPAVAVSAPPPREASGVLAPLRVLSWGRRTR